MMAPKLGWDPDFHIGIRIADSAVNKSCLILGMPGAGKSYAQFLIERSIAADGGCVVATSMNDTHTDQEGSNVIKIDIRKEGFPISFLQTVRESYQREVTETDCVLGLMKLFMGIHSLGTRQKRVFRKALTILVKTCPAGAQELAELGRILLLLASSEKKMKDAAEAVFDIFYELFNGITISPREIVVPGKVVVLDFAGYDALTQKVLSGVTVSAIWNRARTKQFQSDMPVYLALDEFQDLDCKPGGLLEEIIRQGRKYNMNLLLTTQTSSSFNDGMETILQLPATKLFFKQADQDRKRLCALGLVAEEVRSELDEALRGLEKGICLATGKFSVGGVDVDGPLVMSFWEKDVI